MRSWFVIQEYERSWFVIQEYDWTIDGFPTYRVCNYYRLFADTAEDAARKSCETLLLNDQAKLVGFIVIPNRNVVCFPATDATNDTDDEK